VQEKALRALRALKFRDAMDPLTRIFRESPDDAVRQAAVQTIAEIGTLEAGLFLIEVLRHESGELQKTAKERLARFSGEDLAPILKQCLDVEAGESRAALEYVLQAMEGRLPPVTY
jgi:HEAT repeat protein